MGAHWQRLQGSVQSLERELGNATREAVFLRSGDDPATSPLKLPTGPVRRPRPEAAHGKSDPAPPGRPAPPAYTAFTAARYNSTVDGLKSRRRRLALWTVVVAALISATLVAVAVWAHEPTPPLWLAVLPGIWMLPVPFFVLSFFGTQRVLRRNHLNVAGEP